MLVHLNTALMSATDNSAALQVSEEVVDEQLDLEDVPDDGSAEAADDDAPVSQPARID